MNDANLEMERSSRPLPSKIHTSVGAEVLDPERGWIHLCHGYDLYNDLLERYSWSELTYLHLRGEIPTKQQAQVFDLILRSVITPGPTDWATQAAMTAAVTDAPVGNSLLTGLAVLEGRFHGALAIEKNMEMLTELLNVQRDHPGEVLGKIMAKYPDLPGFTHTRSSDDAKVEKILSQLSALDFLGDHVNAALTFGRNQGIQLTRSGLFSAVLRDLGFSPREGHGLFLIAAAPGILAHLVEQMTGKWNCYPFGPPPEYVGPQDRTLESEQRCYKGQHE